MSKTRRSNRKSNSDTKGEKEAPSAKSTRNNSLLSRENVLAAATVVGIAYLAFPLMMRSKEPERPVQKAFRPEHFQKSTAVSVEQRLMEEWQPGDNIKIKEVEEGNVGLFAKWDIQKGQVIASVDFPDLEQELVQEHRSLRPIVQNAVEREVNEQDATWSTVTTGKVLSLIKFLMEDAKGEDSVWHSFIESIPQNVTNMAWYWTAQERQCVIARPDSETLYQDLQVFHAVLEQVRHRFEPLQEIYTRERAEWAYLMLKTRGFGQYFLPILHLANHNPLNSVPAFILPKTGSAKYVATHNIKRGDPIYTDYGSLTPVVSAEQYGFVENEAAFLEVPSIHEDLITNERTKNERLCTREPMKFFGNVTTQVVGTKYGNAGHSTYFKAFMPTELTYACIRVLLQTERDTDVAHYVAEKLEVDLNRYRAIANNAGCQSTEGNFPLIRQANEVTANLLAGALEVAGEGRDWKIPYPNIPSYILNDPE